MREEREFIPTRRSLLSRLKNLDDNESWRVFFETYWKVIYRAAIRAGLTEGEAEDVVQETVIAMSKSIGTFDYEPSRGSFKTYLMRLTGWRIASQFRKRLPVSELPPHLDQGPETSLGPLDRFADPVPAGLEAAWDKEWEENLREAALKRAKAKIDPKLYQVFDLYVNRQWPAERVARDLQVSRAKVYFARHKVGKLVRKEADLLRADPPLGAGSVGAK